MARTDTKKAAEAEAKATEKKAEAKAKAKKETAESDSPDENREAGWLKFWKSNAEAREITTEDGKVRGGMGPKRIKKAKALLKEWGF